MTMHADVGRMQSADEQSLRSSVESEEERVQTLLRQCQAELVKLDRRAARIQSTPTGRDRQDDSTSEQRIAVNYGQPVRRRRLLTKLGAYGEVVERFEDAESSIREELQSLSDYSPLPARRGPD